MTSSNSPVWTLDPRLAADTIPVTHIAGCEVVLMNDRRWPWLILVPQVVGAEEVWRCFETGHGM